MIVSNMADHGKGGILNTANKILRRNKTRVLQSLGKTGKTTDEQLEEDCLRLEKQQEVATRLQKDVRNYIHQARALSVASKALYATLSDTYEAEWHEREKVQEILTNMDVLWQDYLEKLQQQVQEPLGKYLATIPQIKARVSKRGRKLIDYDNAKHNLEVQESAKKRDDAKITRAQEEMEQAKKIYEGLNADLHVELPEFYNSRVTFYSDIFQKLFGAEEVFHGETAKVWGDAPSCDFGGQGSQVVGLINSQLQRDNEGHVYHPRQLRQTISMGSDEPIPNGHSDNGNSGYDSSGHPESPKARPDSQETDSPTSLPRETPAENGAPDEGASASPKKEEADKPEEPSSPPPDTVKADVNVEVAEKPVEDDTDDTKPEEPVSRVVELSVKTDEVALQNDTGTIPTEVDVKSADTDSQPTEEKTQPAEDASQPTDRTSQPITETEKQPTEVIPQTTESQNGPSEEGSQPSEEESRPSEPGEETTKIDEKEQKLEADLPDYPPPQVPTSAPPCLEDPKPSPTPAINGDQDDAEIVQDEDNLYQVPPPPKQVDKTENHPPGYLYTVKATHPYKAEDEDELKFEKDAFIAVVEYDDPDEQDDGWLMGVLNGKKGVFPANFTKRV